MTDDEKHDRSLLIRITESELQRLADLADQIPIATKSSLAREALRLGLDAIERDPGVLLGTTWTTRGGARKGSGRKASK